MIASCSLRDTDSLESGPAASGQGSAGESNNSGNGGEATGGSPNAGNGQGGDAGSTTPDAGEPGEGGAAGQAGAESGGSGGTEPVIQGSFENCPVRGSWKATSYPDEATISATAMSLMIAKDQMLPVYAIDDADKSGTATRFATGRQMAGDEFLSVDLGVEKWVGGVYMNEPSPTDYARQIQVSVSKDGLSFAEVATQEGASGVLKIGFPPVVARHVRISQKGTVTDTSWWAVHDFKVYCTNDAVPSSGGSGNAGFVGGGGKSGAGGTGGN